MKSWLEHFGFCVWEFPCGIFVHKRALINIRQKTWIWAFGVASIPPVVLALWFNHRSMVKLQNMFIPKHCFPSNRFNLHFQIELSYMCFEGLGLSKDPPQAIRRNTQYFDGILTFWILTSGPRSIFLERIGTYWSAFKLIWAHLSAFSSS